MKKRQRQLSTNETKPDFLPCSSSAKQALTFFVLLLSGDFALGSQERVPRKVSYQYARRRCAAAFQSIGGSPIRHAHKGEAFIAPFALGRPSYAYKDEILFSSTAKHRQLGNWRPNTQRLSPPRMPALLSSTVNDWTPLYLSSIAGASTCIGASIVFLFPKQDDGQRQISPEIMAFSLALAGSVMMTVSAISIGPECLLDLSYQPEVAGEIRLISFASVQFLQRAVAFGLGCMLYALLRASFPEPDEVLGFDADNNDASGSAPKRLALATTESNLDNEHHAVSYLLPDNESIRGTHGIMTMEQQRAWRVAWLLFISLLFHNFPEGLAVAASALESDKLGLAVTAGIMIHNIPEGIAIAVPCLAARPESPWLAFVLASFSGLAEPLGALVTLLFLQGGFAIQEGSSSSGPLFGMQNVLAFVAGIMIAVALVELVPEARRQISKCDSQGAYYGGLLCGCAVMCITEWVLEV